MADPAVLAALLGNSELQNFRDTIAGGNIYSQLAPAVGGVKWDRTGMSTGQQFGTSLAQSFLAAALGKIGQNQVASQVAQATSLLPDLYSNPSEVVIPEGIDPEAGAMLKGVSILKQRQREAIKQEKKADWLEKLAEMRYGAGLEGLKEESRILGQNAGYGVEPSKNPNSPQYKFDKDLFDIERKYTNDLLTGKQAEQALNINRAARNIMEATKKDNPVAASTAIFEFAKLQDPTGTVREADELRVSDPGGPLGRLAQVYNEIQQKGKLTPDGKKYLRELVPVMLTSQFDSYNQVRDSLLTSAESYGASKDRIQYVKPVDLSGYLNEPSVAPETKQIAGPGGMATYQRVNGGWQRVK